jgi:hypothetical protein
MMIAAFSRTTVLRMGSGSGLSVMNQAASRGAMYADPPVQGRDLVGRI